MTRAFPLTLILCSLAWFGVACQTLSSVHLAKLTPRVTSTTDTLETYAPSPESLAPTIVLTRLPTPDATPTVAGCVSPTHEISPTQRVHVPILMYHHLQVVPPEQKGNLRGLSVSPEEFEQQVAYLAAHNYHTIYFADLVAYLHKGCALPDNPIILTFDDAWVEQYTVAFPILQKYRMVGTFFPPTNWVDRAKVVLSWAQVAEMSTGGMEFGSHTQTHWLMYRRTDEQNRLELLNSKQILEEHTGKLVVALAYPGGGFNADVIKVVGETGYGAAVTTLYGNEQRADEIYTLHRVGIRYDDTLDMFVAKLR